MKKYLGAFAAAGLAGLSFAPTPLPVTAAVAGSPSEAECDELGGDFYRLQGQVYCIVETHVGNSGNSATTTDEESSNGTLNNKPKHEEDCTGPGSSDSSAHCPK